MLLLVKELVWFRLGLWVCVNCGQKSDLDIYRGNAGGSRGQVKYVREEMRHVATKVKFGLR